MLPLDVAAPMLSPGVPTGSPGTEPIVALARLKRFVEPVAVVLDVTCTTFRQMPVAEQSEFGPVNSPCPMSWSTDWPTVVSAPARISLPNSAATVMWPW